MSHDWRSEFARVAQEPTRVTVRELLSWFGARRRGSWVVSYIRSRLDQNGLETEPDFSSVYLIDTEVEIRLKTAQSQVEPDGATSADAEDAASAGVGPSDPTYRIGNMASANKPVVHVKPDSPRAEAVTLMMEHDFSQLPVMQSEREVKGMISWASIGKKLVTNQVPDFVRDCMEPHVEIGADKSLFSAVDGIIRNEYVLVRGPDQTISGIVTTADLSREFNALAEPFLLLGEIENHLRVLIESAFTQDELTAVRDPADAARLVSSASDLAFGEYIRLLETKENWTRLGLDLDRKTILQGLTKIKDIRNDVMHFSPDPLEDSAMEFLKSFHKMLRELVELRRSGSHAPHSP